MSTLTITDMPGASICVRSWPSSISMRTGMRCATLVKLPLELSALMTANSEPAAGENRVIETHLIPLVLQVALEQRDKISVFGTDWPTPDGTAVRDYIHVLDLAEAHLLALESSVPGEHRIYNLGSGAGFSVREVIAACARVTGLPINVEDASRRLGDPAVLIASSDKAIAELGWTPTRTDLDVIVADAWQFLQDLGDRSHAAR